MKRLISFLVVILFIASLCSACATGLKSEESVELGYIIRDDIQFEDLGFVIEEGEIRTDITQTDMMDALGWPYAGLFTISGVEYLYFFEDERCGEGKITFIFSDNGYYKGIDLETEKETPSVDDLVEKEITDPDQYKEPRRYNIKETDLSFIEESTTSVEVQEALGAPHNFMHRDDVETKTIAFVYFLSSGDWFLIAYEYGGVIVKAWVIDEEGNTQKVYIDRTDIYGTTNDE